MGKFFLGALVGSGLTGAVGTWLAGQVPVVASPTIENRVLVRELYWAHGNLRAIVAERDRNAVLARAFLDLIAHSSRTENGPVIVISSEE